MSGVFSCGSLGRLVKPYAGEVVSGDQLNGVALTLGVGLKYGGARASFVFGPARPAAATGRMLNRHK